MKVIFRLTKQQRAALLLAATRDGLSPRRGPHRRMLRRLEENGLVSWGRSGAFLTKGGALALRAQPRDSVWWPTLPDLENSHAVRKLVVCKGCGKLYLDLPKFDGVSMHAACIVMHHGWQALAELPNEELNKMTAQDFGYLGLTIVDLEEALDWKAA